VTEFHIHVDLGQLGQGLLQAFKDHLARKEAQMSELTDAIEEMRVEVAEQTTVTQSAITLLNQLVARVEQALADDNPDQARAILAEIRGNTDALAAAVTANTPPA
jgi:small-conductance mechanosensitive channel